MVQFPLFFSLLHAALSWKSRVLTAMESRAFAFRLRPGEDLKSGVIAHVQENCGSDSSAWIVTCVGSLTRCTIRLANAEAGKPNDVIELDGRYEILSLVGTVSPSTGSHLHISLGDKDGAVIGGHLMGDATVFTTAEVVCGYSPGIQFTRPFDPRTGYPELDVEMGNQHGRWMRDLTVASIFFSLGCLIATKL